MEFTRTTRGRRDLRTTSSLRSRRCGAVPTFSVPAQKDTTDMKKNVAPFVLLAASIAAQAAAQERRPADIPHQDHIFVILMENHGYRQIINNPNEPYLNGLIAKRKVNLARQLFCHRPPQSDELSGDRRRFEFRGPQRQSTELGQCICVPNIAERLVERRQTIRRAPGRRSTPIARSAPLPA